MIVKIVAENWIRPEAMAECLPLVQELVEKSAAEDSCIEYRLFADREDEYHLVIVEEWASEEGLDAHRETEHFRRILPQVGQFMSKPSTILRMKPL